MIYIILILAIIFTVVFFADDALTIKEWLARSAIFSAIEVYIALQFIG